MLGLAPQPRVCVLIAGEPEFDSDGAAELEVSSGVDLAHPAGADALADLIAADHHAPERSLRARGAYHGRLLDEPGRLVVRLQQPLDLTAHGRVLPACHVQKRRAVAAVPFDCSVKQLFYP